ncbi:MAG: Gfo/Idh/MocA family oxidoreductase [Rhodoglobus sp.]
MTGTGRVGVGVIGAGVISTQYLENLTTFADIEVLFVADIDLERAGAQAERFGVPGHGTVDELLAHPGIEIVVNLTIPAAHVEVALRALAAGKNVWSEKPFALDRESGRALLAESARTGLRVATAPDTFLGAGLQTGKRLIAEGSVGAPLTASAVFQASGPEAWHPNPDFLYAEGAGPLFDMGPYYLTALVQNFGAVKRVSAVASRSLDTRVIATGPRAGEEFPVAVPTQVSALLEFESGASAEATFSFQSSIRRTSLEISGSTGTVVFPDPNTFDGDVLVWRDRAEQAEVHPAVGPTIGRGIGIVELARAIRADLPERATGEQAYHVLDVMVSITEAASTGDWVDVVSTVAPSPALPESWDPAQATL